MLRVTLAAIATGLLLVGQPAVAQVAITPSPNSPDAVGPSQLKDFNLNGTVIRQSDTASSAPAAAAPERRAAPRPQATAPTATAARTEPAQPRAEAPAREQSRTSAETRQAAAPSAAAPDRASAAIDLERLSPAQPVLGPAPALPAAAALPSSGLSPVQSYPGDGGGFSPLPWILALIAAGIGGFVYFRRHQSRLSFAGGAVSEFVAPEPEAPRAPPPPSPVRRPAKPVGVVSTSLRPWLDLRFQPDRLVINEQGAMLAFEAVVANSGAATGRDVLVEAVMLNAGPDQDRELTAFFNRPAGQGSRVPGIEPLNSMSFATAVSLSTDQMIRFKAGERTLFVPIIAFNILYRHGDRDAQTSAAFLVGQENGGEKLGPFGLDQGPRAFHRLGARPLDLHVRS